ncbi:MAG TPA: hypothetical protein VLB82_04185 [Thermodesulfobacteriota bacterium]|nr:hypothetical protein [Thermodesulfobacteriota bacterium]
MKDERGLDMKNTILGLMLGTMFLSWGGIDEARAGLTPPQQNLFNAIIHSCEKKFFACYTDKALTASIINSALSVPPETVPGLCDAVCNSSAI